MRAVTLVPNRTLVDECSAQGVLDDGEPPPADPALRDRIAALESRIATVDSLARAGQYHDARQEAEAIVTRPRRSATPPPEPARSFRWAWRGPTSNGPMRRPMP